MLVRVHQEQAELHAAREEFARAFAVHKVFFAAYNELHSLQREAQARTRQAMFETAEARQEAERFREQARRDPLTGLRNRRYVDEQLPALIEDAGVTGLRSPWRSSTWTTSSGSTTRSRTTSATRCWCMVAELLETELAAAAPPTDSWPGWAARSS